MLSDWIIIFRLVLAAVLSGMIGFEREFHGRAAGFRTHILLCMGSTLVMITSIHIFEVYNASVPCDPARIAAGVVTGIGFLGAGAIMRSRASVRGLTTAASLWVVAGIGLGIGSGLYLGSIAATALTMITLMFFSRIEHAMIRRDWYRNLVIEIKEGADRLKALREILSEYNVDITDFEADRAKEGGVMALKLGIKLYHSKHANRLIEDIGRLEGVSNVKWDVD